MQPDGDGGGDNCMVRIEYRTFTDVGTHVMELVKVVVDDPKPPVPSESLCPRAKALAAQAATNLPR